ncbi:hypothetical protein ACHWQZ_G015067 [Mnemiopsis leidyi]
MDDSSQVIIQTTCSVSLSTEGSIIPFTPGDVYLCASDNADMTDLWCLVVLHKRNFPRKYSIVRQLTKITVRKRGNKIGFIVIEFDDTNQVKLKDFPSDPTFFAKVLDFCFNNKTDPELIIKLKDEKLKDKLQDIDTKPAYNGSSSGVEKPIVIDISPESSSRGSTFEHFDDQSVSSLGSLESAEFVDAHKAIRRSFAGSKRALDAGCITPPVRCIASIEETRVINEADVEEIPEKEQATIVTKNHFGRSSGRSLKQKMSLHRGYHSMGSSPVSPSLLNGDSFLLNGDLPSQEPLLVDNSPQDVVSVASSHGSGSTPPREFVVSAFEPNNCGAEFTVSSQNSYDEIRGKFKGTMSRQDKRRSHEYPKYSTFNYPATSPPLSSFPDVSRRSKRRLTSSMPSSQEESLKTSQEPAAKERRRILSDGTSTNISCKRSTLNTIHSRRSRLKSSPSIPDRRFSSYLQRIQHTLYNGSDVGEDFAKRSKSYDFVPEEANSETKPGVYRAPGVRHKMRSDHVRVVSSKQENGVREPVKKVERGRDVALGYGPEMKQDQSELAQEYEKCDSDFLPATIIESTIISDELDSMGSLLESNESEKTELYSDSLSPNNLDHDDELKSMIVCSPTRTFKSNEDVDVISVDKKTANDEVVTSSNTESIANGLLDDKILDETDFEEQLTNGIHEKSPTLEEKTDKELGTEECKPDLINDVGSIGLEDLSDGIFMEQRAPNTSPVSDSTLDTQSVKSDSTVLEKLKKRNLRPREPVSNIRTRGETTSTAKPDRPRRRSESDAGIVSPGIPKPHGFINLGNTCYMNCVLQCVLTVPAFKTLLHAPTNPFRPTLFNCLAALLQRKASCGGTKEKRELLIKVKNLISDATSLFKGSRQQDAHEFLGKFLDVLREERKHSLKCPVSRTFQCEVIHTVRCVGCRAGGQKTEKYYDFSLNLPGRNLQPHSLADLLEDYFATDNVELKCSTCGHDTAQVQHRFSQLPQALVLHVQRYAFSRSGSREGKRQDSIMIPSRLDITKLGKDCVKGNPCNRVSIPDSNTPPVPHNLRTRTKGLYSLHAVISHLGESRECGHYICDVRESGQWYFYDDVNMHVIDLHYVRAQRKNSCYLFFYLKDDNLLES